MIVYWNQQGRPLGACQHRLTKWSSVIGGILEVNGLPGFLDNVDDASDEFSTELEELAGLAEAAVVLDSPMVVVVRDLPEFINSSQEDPNE